MESQNVVLKLEDLDVKGLDIDDKQITKIACSSDHVQCILSSGEAFAFGNNLNGKLGTGTKNTTEKPEIVRCMDKLVDVACGSNFTVWISEAHEVYSCGIPSALIPVKLNGKSAISCAAYGDSLALIDTEGGVTFWSNFADINNPVNPPLIGKAKSISCGNQFVAVLFDNGLLAKITHDKCEYLCVKSHIMEGGETFISMSACADYIIAIDYWKRAYIFGDFNGYSAQYLQNEPVFCNADRVWAMPGYCCARTSDMEILGIGKIPSPGGSRLIRVSKELSFSTGIGEIVGNEGKLFCLEILFDRETLTKSVKHFVPIGLTNNFPVVRI